VNSTIVTTPMNTLLLHNLIEWAEYEENLAADTQARLRIQPATSGPWAGWGHWFQGAWAMTTPDAAADTVHLDPELARELRNGACQTSYCMAGQTVVQAGYRIMYNDDRRDLLHADMCVLTEPNGRFDAKGRPLHDDVPGTAKTIEGAAQAILGLTDSECEEFFNGDNTVDHLKAMADDFLEHRGLARAYETVSSGYYEDTDEEVLYSFERND